MSKSLLYNCLEPLLIALKWGGTKREFFEAIPHRSTISTVENFCLTMKNLEYNSNLISLNLNKLDARLIPCLFVPKDGSAPLVLIEAVGDGISVYDSKKNSTEILRNKDIAGTVIIFKKHEENEKGKARPKPEKWFRDAIEPRKNLLYYVGFLTLLQALLMLATPLFIINVYDKVIVTGSKQMLIAFFVGVLMSMVALSVIMMVRFRILAHVGIYIQEHVGNTIFKHLLMLPPVYTESAPVSMQITRLNDFSSVRDFFSSPLCGTLIEIPFLFIYLIVIWLIGGILVLVPLGAILTTSLVSYMLWHTARKNISAMSAAQLHQQDFLVETLQGMHSLHYSNLQEKWKERFRKMSSKTSLCNQKLLLMSSSSDAIFDILTIIFGLATLMLGALLVINEQIQIGALIGTMFIIWRILTPIKTMNMMAPKIIQLRRSIGQINELMRIPLEQKSHHIKKNAPTEIKGEITFSQVGFRYPGSYTSALTDINFTVKRGQVLALGGLSAAGKTTVLNLILAMYTPQVGRIFIDGTNIQQYDINLLRTNIAYVPQQAELFYGTIAQNLRLADPTVSSQRLIEAAKYANFLKDIEVLPDGFDTRIRDYGVQKLGGSFSQKMSIARAYLRDAPILIMDEPATALDTISESALLNTIAKARGKQTIILITHQTSQIRVADVVLILNEGKQIMFGKPEDVLEKVPEELI